MKTINEKHDVIIQSISSFKGDIEPKEGEIVEYFEQVDSLEFYVLNPAYVNTYIKVGFGRDFIVDLYNQIQEIEKIVVNKPYENLPF